jgi:hypothetical protein
MPQALVNPRMLPIPSENFLHGNCRIPEYRSGTLLISLDDTDIERRLDKWDWEPSNQGIQLSDLH